jgi:hypothetical protein
MVDIFKDVYRLKALIIVGLSKEECISLATRRKSSCATHKHDWNKCGHLEQHTLPKQIYWKYETENTKMEPPKPNSLEKQMGHNPP